MASPAGRAHVPGTLALVPTAPTLPPPPEYGGSPTKALIDHLSFLTANKLAAAAAKPAKKQQKEESSDDDEDYPPDPQQCTVSGSGFSGGASGAPVKLIIYIKDSRGRRMKEGGEDVLVRVLYSATSEHVYVDVTDNEDGTYTAVYTPPGKGNYQVTVEVNGISIGGSPFPVFFSAPLDPAALAAQQAAQEQDGAKPAAPLEPTSITSMAAAAGISAVQAITDEHLRTLFVGNISPAVPFERLRELFAIFGTILDMSVLGDRKDMAMVVFANKEAQGQGQQLNNTQFGDRRLNVTAPMSAMAAGIVPANPQLAMQMQQIQQMQQTLIHSQKLAAQVAQMRAYNKTGLVVREDPQKAAQEAAARIASKLTGGSRFAAELAAAGASAAAAAANANMAELVAVTAFQKEEKDAKDKDRKASRSRSRSRSPGRRRSRSRDRRDDRQYDRGGRNQRDNYQNDRMRERERRDREMRERERMHQNKERERERERQRAREREREREREERLRGRARDLSREGRKERKRSRSASPEARPKDRHRDRAADKDKDAPRARRDRSRDEADGRGSSRRDRADKDAAPPREEKGRRGASEEAPSGGEGAKGSPPPPPRRRHSPANGHSALPPPPPLDAADSPEPPSRARASTPGSEDAAQPEEAAMEGLDGDAAPQQPVQQPAAAAPGEKDVEKRGRHKERSYRTKKADDIAGAATQEEKHRSKSPRRGSRSPRRKDSKKSSHKSSHKERKRDREEQD